jgi:hypothetical protein
MEESGKYTAKYAVSANVLKIREVDKEVFFYLAENSGAFLKDAVEEDAKGR